MSHRAGMSEVRFKVRHNALVLHEFTVADMVRATKLNPESIRTELQRMKQEGLLTSRSHPDKPSKRGGHPALYELTEDPEARLALSESIEAFYPSLSPTERPTSRHYLLARQLLDRAQTADTAIQNRLLSDAQSHLEMAEQAEGGSLSPEPVKAYLMYERTRLLYLRGKRAEAREEFESLREFFVEVQDETMIRHTDEFLLCLKAQDRFTGVIPNGMNEVAFARCLLDTLTEEAYRTSSPLSSLLLKMVSLLSRTADERVRAAAFDLASEMVTSRDFEAAKRAVRTEFFGGTKLLTQDLLQNRGAIGKLFAQLADFRMNQDTNYRQTNP
jgi:hypothetical protein